MVISNMRKNYECVECGARVSILLGSSVDATRNLHCPVCNDGINFLEVR